MNALTLLKQDHDEVKKLLSQLDDTSERAAVTREKLFAKVKRELAIHETIEEEILYPAFKQQAKLKDIVLEGYEEHHIVDLVVNELSSLPTDAEAWAAKLTVIKENVEHHMQEEEGEMFKTARTLFDHVELEQLGTQLEVRKKQLQAETPEELARSREAA